MNAALRGRGAATTLVRIMLGLLKPTGGEVLVDGIPLSVIGPRAFREHVGAVMQQDQCPLQWDVPVTSCPAQASPRWSITLP